ncbi:hypothetical protein [Bradyrhizobium ivorense]|nr:hypothetical protein [Bradyrhizobium ivorense]
MKVLMQEATLFLAMSIGIVGATVVSYVGATLLRNVRDDVEAMLRILPTRAAEEKAEAREENRSRARTELIHLLLVRSAPGAILALFGFFLLCSLSSRVLDIASAVLRASP